MNVHYVRFFSMLRSGRYFHVGTKPVRKSYGYVGNTVQQMRCLIEADASIIQGRTFYLCDDPIELSAWAEAFREALQASPIRRIPVTVAKGVALVGDAIAASGWRNFPFTSFRLRNVMLDSVVDNAPIRSLCGPPPYSLEYGVARTVEWLQSLWSGAVELAGMDPGTVTAHA
jgi:nucleoside-diphosphate-sugar epimerase